MSNREHALTQPELGLSNLSTQQSQLSMHREAPLILGYTLLSLSLNTDPILLHALLLNLLLLS